MERAPLPAGKKHGILSPGMDIFPPVSEPAQ
jgi:hypothetical protein